MNDDYLWDGSGEPDPEIQRLENVLGRFRHHPPAPEWPEPVSLRDRLRSGFILRHLAPVGATAFLVVVAVLMMRTPEFSRIARPGSVPRAATGPSAKIAPAGVEVARLSGLPKAGSEQVRETGRLREGEWLVTDASSRARISLDKVGQVQVDPNTRIRLVETRPGEHRLALERGTIHALIWAPPFQFFVETPSAVAVDLGCAYTLKVDNKGAGLLRATFGWVGFKFNGREAFIPAGAVCATRPGIGPGTPFFADAPRPFRAALEKVDFEFEGPEARALKLKLILSEARRRDALTLWHLVSRLEGSERKLVYDRLAALIPPPAGVTPEGVLRGDKQMLDLWWNQLGLGETSWWRRWEREWPPQTSR